jgi:hypothetical protein
METILRTTGEQQALLKNHLFPGDGKEAVAVALCGRRAGAERHILAVNEILLIPYDQCRVRAHDRVEWGTELIVPLLEKAMKYGMAVVKIHSHPGGENHDDLQKCKSFHELWQLIRKILGTVTGLGELYIYDTALRIGAYLNILPERVYLHAGTRTGAKAFGITSRHTEWLDVDELPAPLKELPPHEVEDILCIYKGDAKGDTMPVKRC